MHALFVIKMKILILIKWSYTHIPPPSQLPPKLKTNDIDYWTKFDKIFDFKVQETGKLCIKLMIIIFEHAIQYLVNTLFWHPSLKPQQTTYCSNIGAYVSL